MGTYTAMVMRSAGAGPEPEVRPIPEPAAGEVLVRLRATSLNYHDLVNLRGVIRGPWPRVPMSDARTSSHGNSNGLARNVPSGWRYAMWPAM